jgi:hypothetical protein
MKACDIQGVKVLDNVFLSDPVDTFYSCKKRTRNYRCSLHVMSRKKAASVKYSALTVQILQQMLLPGW